MEATCLAGYKFIANPLAGRGKAIHLPRVIADFARKHKVETDLVYTTRSGEAVELAQKAAEEKWPAVIAVGGDGTASEVLNGLIGTGVPMGIIPSGTGNDLARSIGVPFSFEGALECLVRSEVQPMDVGIDGGRYFCELVGLGLPSDAMAEANRWTKSPLGRQLKGSVNIAAGLAKALVRLRAVRTTIYLDDRVVEARSVGVFVMNTRYAGKGLLLAPGAQLTDGHFDIIVLGEVGRLEVARVFPRVFVGKHLSHPRVHLYRSRAVKIRTEVPLRKMYDGDVDGFEPIDTRIVQGLASLLVPRPQL